MTPKVFITGGTGYIGGSVLHTVVKTFPEVDITVMLRSIPADLTTYYPKVNIVKGDYDSAEVLSDAASKANIVIHMGDSDHVPALKAVIAGVLNSQTGGTPFLIHLSGTAIVAEYQDPASLGKLSTKTWSDVDDLPAISTLPDAAIHRNTEKLLFDTAKDHGDKVNIAIVCPPDIYGPGKGLAKTWSALVPLFIDQAKKLDDGAGRTFYYNEGTNARSWVHIDDLMRVYVKLVEAAIKGGEGAEWGEKGYYFASTQEVDQKTLATALGSLLKKHNIISNAEPIQVPLEQLDAMINHPLMSNIARYLFAANSRTKPDRAQRLFGYGPKAPGLLECLEADILAEVEREKQGK